MKNAIVDSQSETYITTDSWQHQAGAGGGVGDGGGDEGYDSNHDEDGPF